jgi:hypothetical protein
MKLVWDPKDIDPVTGKFLKDLKKKR